MIAIKKEPGKLPVTVEIPNTLKALQKEVDGYIETVTVASDMCFICNEEGRLRGLEHNFSFVGIGFVGTVLAVGIRGEKFTDCPHAESLLQLLSQEEKV